MGAGGSAGGTWVADRYGRFIGDLPALPETYVGEGGEKERKREREREGEGRNTCDL